MTNEERNIRLHEQFMGLCWHKWEQVIVGGISCDLDRCAKCGQKRLIQHENPNYFSMPDYWKLVEKLEETHDWQCRKYWSGKYEFTAVPHSTFSAIMLESLPCVTLPEAICAFIERMKGWQL
ncbi:MAG: hypothetical protein M0R06_22995 [Sphaerochaeta sp.]|jgi:hypothetical protein|nr:hypothetical protein [Sphaerochaeta sp.]